MRDFLGLARKELMANADRSDEAVARAILSAVQSRAELIELMFPICVREIQHLRRGSIEVPAETKIAKILTDSGGIALTRPGEMKALLRETFSVPGQFTVTWGEAEDWHYAARIEFLTKQVRGIEQNIFRLEEARGLLRRHGKKCLNEIYTVKKKAA